MHSLLDKGHRKITCQYCAYETDARDLFCEVCYRPMMPVNPKHDAKKKDNPDRTLFPNAGGDSADLDLKWK